MELSQANIIGEFNTVIGEIARAQARATKGIGKALVMCVYGSIVLKDAGMTEALTKCLRKSTKQTGIKAFIEHFGNVAFTSKGVQYFDAKREWTEEFKTEVIKASLAWEEFKPETEVEAIDVEAKLMAIIKATTSANKTGREVKHAALVESIQTIIAEYHAAQFNEAE